MFRIGDILAELLARRLGRRFVPADRARAMRDLTGSTGLGTSRAWDEASRGADAYIDSFDRRLPPSLHISHRDQVRLNQPMPLVERCIEDWEENHRTN